jgi:hypothetical protein
MPPIPPWNIYREQLSSLFHGFALWEPEPVKGLYDKVSIGDVGYISNGVFYRMFNVTLPWNDPSNRRLGIPYSYKRLDCSGEFVNVRNATFGRGDYNTPNVSGHRNIDNPLPWTSE